ncbi:MAG TPA: Eco57I restriction-modification methylase domain-containing protein [Steroidobacteraceae bacterium]|nr:Eco57I restriction-modification methylase domain-containing protein [Steroidobacteraceae bacterium]
MQLSLEYPASLTKAAYDYGTRSDGGTHGLVLTKPHIVDLILDLSGYTANTDLTKQRLLEPACGHGAFLLPAIDRLAASAKRQGVRLQALVDAIAAFDIDDEHVAITRNAVVETLGRHGMKAVAARAVAERWVQQADFLLTPIVGQFDFVVGNPPYIRIEQLSPLIQAEYRRRYATLFDRADLYIAFIERSLQLLASKGVVGFICADRWTLNKYGAPLRELVSRDYSVRTYIDLHKTSPFEAEVIAYPSIFVIANEPGGKPVRVVRLSVGSPEECAAVVSGASSPAAATNCVQSETYTTWFANSDPWVLSSPDQLATLRDLESRFPLLEESGGTSVRIGIATGNDSIYIVPEDADIEPDRLLPLVMRSDIDNGRIRDARRCVINTYEEKGVISLDKYPRLKRYFDKNAETLKRRHVAQKDPVGWCRTIDRPYPKMVGWPKLLIPDIAGSNEVIYEPGNFYPHHNLYFVISDDWDMEVLGGLLSSRVALFFVWSYAVKMRGGYLRFQAQYLRRIRVPRPDAVPEAIAARIKTAYRARDFSELDDLSREVYGLTRLPDFDFVDTRVRPSPSC